MKEIPLSKGRVALVDDADFEYLSQWSWHASYDRGSGTWYARRSDYLGNYKQNTVRMHRDLLKAGLDDYVDHRDGDGLNNTRANIRLCTPQQNAHNRRKYARNTSGFKGVFEEKRWGGGRWMAKIRVDGNLKHLGSFGTKDPSVLRRRQLWPTTRRLRSTMESSLV